MWTEILYKDEKGKIETMEVEGTTIEDCIANFEGEYPDFKWYQTEQIIK